MRPPGEVRQALLTAARDLARPADQRGATLTELAGHAQVGILVARRTVDHMRRSGQLEIVAERRVDYRNRPVAEYMPADQLAPEEQAGADLEQAIALWER